MTKSDASEEPRLIGYQEIVRWRGTNVLTLADVWPSNPRAMIVGLNPAPRSVRIGHYYQGTVGQRQLRRLASAGLFSEPDGTYFETSAMESGVGFTDIVKLPTAGEKGVSREDIAHGREDLVAKLAALGVDLVVCVFRHPVQALLGDEGRPGMQSSPAPWGGRVFRMPGPYSERAAAERAMGELKEYLNS